MVTIFQVETDDHRRSLKELFSEYSEWANSMTNREYGINFDVKSMVEHDMLELGKFSPPAARLLLAQYEDQIAGIGALRKIAEDTAEIKRMYVRPDFRGKGVGRALLTHLIREARLVGYTRVRLDSAQFMKQAHALYRSAGFEEIKPYPESEIPPEFHSHWIFMELLLR